MQLPDRSTLAAGAASVLGWALIKFGVPALAAAVPALAAPLALITQTDAVAFVGGLATLASHFTPDSVKDIAKKLDADVKDVAAIMPQTYSAPEDFPQRDMFSSTSTNNLNVKGAADAD